MESYEGYLSILGWDYWFSRRLKFPDHFKAKAMLFPDKSFCVLKIIAWPLPPKNFTDLTQKLKPVEEWKDTGVSFHAIISWDFKLTGRLIFLYHFKTNGMLFSDKSFCVFAINCCSLPPKNFTILTQKIKPVEEWKDTGVYYQYYTVPWLYIHPFVYVTMTNFSAIYKREKWSLNFPIVSFYFKKDD